MGICGISAYQPCTVCTEKRMEFLICTHIFYMNIFISHVKRMSPVFLETWVIRISLQYERQSQHETF
jgi:hypothetical protein